MRNVRRACTSSMRSYLRDDAAQAVTEYILIIGLIVIPFAVAFNKLAATMRTVLERVNRLLYGPGI